MSTMTLIELLGGIIGIIVGAIVIYKFVVRHDDTRAVYKPLDWDKKEVDKAQKVLGVSDDVRKLADAAIEFAHYKLWVLDCGKDREVYKRDFLLGSYRFTPYALYRDDDNRECRKITVSQKVEGGWQGSIELHCRIEGMWEQME